MTSVRWVALLTLIFSASLSLRAQQLVPTLAQPIPAQRIGATPVPLDLRNYFGVPGVTGQIVQFTTISGRFNVDLLLNEAPRHVANFLSYTNNRAFDNTLIHHVIRPSGTTAATVHGGAFVSAVPPVPITREAAIPLEYNVANTRGTLASAHLPNDPNSATSEWFFNTQDNSTVFGPTSPGGGYTVFGRVLGGTAGLSVVDMLGQFQTYNLSGTPFTSIPLRNVSATQTQITVGNYIVVTSVRPIPLYPTMAGETAVLTFTASRSNTTVVNISVSGSTLLLSPLAIGTANVAVRATDTNGNFVDTTFAVTVTTQPLLNPLFTSQPASRTVATDSTAVFNATASGSPTFQWTLNGVPIEGATSASLVVPRASAANAGTYRAIATNVVGSTTSAPATLEVTAGSALTTGRLTNLSILTSAGTGARALTMGAVVGPQELGASLPLLIRAVGPTLQNAPFGVPGVMEDPQLVVNRSGSSIPVAFNDDWNGNAALSAGFSAVGAFALSSNLDSAVLLSSSAAEYTVQVTGKSDAPGMVIAELYDSSTVNRTTATPRLINVSTLTQIDAGSSLTVGFVIGGQTARTVLVRGVGPSLATFNVPDVMADPRLELFDNQTSQKIGENDDWGGDAQLVAMGRSVGAFALMGPTTKDAMILVTLPPGPYSARITGVGATGGTAIVEVYEVP